ncbi:MAG: GGDEF domain-containing protein [Armatimonadetes bacterium]|nr:GGDEF domain-containing protein [Armatimonadota bacterium]
MTTDNSVGQLMTPEFSNEEQTAVREAQQIIRDAGRSAPALLESLAERYQSEGKTVCAFEVRRMQCFALIGNLEFRLAVEKIELLMHEAAAAEMPRFVGVGEMYRGLVWLDIGQSHRAIECFDRAIQIGIDTEDLDLIYRVQINLSFAQSMLEQYEESLETLKQSIQFSDSLVTKKPGGSKAYNMAAAEVQVAYQARERGSLSQSQIQAVRRSLDRAEADCKDEFYLPRLLGIFRALFVGLDEGFDKGIEQLRQLRPEIETGASVHLITYLLGETRILEAAERWEELRYSATELIDRMKESGWLAAIRIALKRASKASAKLGDYQTAYELLNELVSIEGQSAGSNRDSTSVYFEQEVLRMCNRALVERNKILEQEARFDRLSGILNRRGMEEALAELTQRSGQHRLVVAMLDIDYFKRINDQFGHAVGDQVIQEFAACLANSKTKPSRLGRWGGEEFVLVYEEEAADPSQLGATLMDEVRHYPWEHVRSGMAVTASCGLAIWSQGDSIDHTIRVADDMMYAVKHQGRNNWRLAA